MVQSEVHRSNASLNCRVKTIPERCILFMFQLRSNKGVPFTFHVGSNASLSMMKESFSWGGRPICVHVGLNVGLSAWTFERDHAGSNVQIPKSYIPKQFERAGFLVRNSNSKVYVGTTGNFSEFLKCFTRGRSNKVI